MKKILLLSMISAAFALGSCSSDEEQDLQAPSVSVDSNEATRAQFAEDDGKKVMSGAPHIQAKNLINKVPTDYIAEMTDTLGRANITKEQYAEIQDFAVELTVGLSTNKDKYLKCFNWVVDNIKYEYANNDPYPVFKNKVGICQGYANLLFIMLHSLDIPAFVCNGILNPIGAHAWNYVYCDGKWYVSDPTNNGSWILAATSNYSHLLPSSFDVVLAKENGVWFNYNEYHLNICSVESSEEIFVVPFSALGYQVTSFSPTKPLNPNIKQINIGKNIKSLGESYMGLMYNAPNVEHVEVDPENTTFASYLGVVYRKDGNEFQLTYIPAAMKCVELMPMVTMYKNTVYRHDAMEVLIVAPGTKKIEAWGVENCPNLKIAYVPEDTEIANNAFTGVHPDFQIIRGDYTNIPEIRED
ncbi:MAG: transglutaminase domain-containing protein [Bacteroidaceae bacterium]|nr:transglutaminase domain-containing protein [Bacteroidaceae bacterium]